MYQALDGFQPALTAKLHLCVQQGQLLLNETQSLLWSDLTSLQNYIVSTPLVTGLLDQDYVGIVAIDASFEHTAEAISLRQAMNESSANIQSYLSHATQILTHYQTQKFCPCCGGRTVMTRGEWGRRCDGCQQMVYPRISPCIIVAVTKGDEILLVKHQRHGKKNSMHTVVAGFIEPGESAEQAVAREVLEETGLQVSNIRYRFSQSWPFPHSLMFAFEADYESGEILLEEEELYFGGWFHRDSLPELPPSFTIARQLVEGWRWSME